jgi:NitT/TauT family transport system substrate-binding protein
MKKYVLLAVSLATLAASACGSGNSNAADDGRVTLRLGYFANVTHAQPQVGLARGTFAEALGPDVALKTTTFNAGPSVIEALFAGEIDASYIGPNPAINGYVRSRGKELRIIAGATSGGARLIVRAGANIHEPADFHGKKIATPQLGNTQDVALRAWLASNGLNAREQGGDVQVLPVANADQLTLFQKGEIDGAWAPEPWASRLELEAGGVEFLDETSLWPEGKFVTTNLIVRTSFLEDHPDVVRNLLRAHVDTTLWIQQHPQDGMRMVNDSIGELTGKPLSEETIERAWAHMNVTYDPLAATLFKSAADAYDLGFLGNDEPDLSGIYALDPLNAVLSERNLPVVKAE